MKIIKLTAENVKKLVAVEIAPDGNVVQITGKNGSGKSSVLDAIWWALAGADHIQAAPIRKGQNKARIRLELGDGKTAELIVERRFSEKDSRIVVENTAGARFPEPQRMLNALIGALSFDPLQFAQAKAATQYETLRKLVKLDVDIDALDGLNVKDHEARTEVNRSARALRAQADGIALPPDCPTDRRDTQEILGRLTKVSAHNTAIIEERGVRAEFLRKAESHRQRSKVASTEAARLRNEADVQEGLAIQHEQEADRIKAEHDALPAMNEPQDAAAIRSELESAEDHNRMVEQQERKAALVKDAETKEARATELTGAIDARKTERAAAIARAKMPVDGLGLADGTVTFGGIPFEQASSAEQLRVSIAIAMAANPKLRVIRVQDGSLLDEDGLKMLAEMARDHDYQVWIERVSDSGKAGIVLEDGHIKGAEVADEHPKTLLPLGV